MLAVLVVAMAIVAAVQVYGCRKERAGAVRLGPLGLPRWVRVLGVVVAVGLAAFPYAAAVVGERGQENPAFGATAQRFGSVGSNRYAYWRVAVRTFADHPLGGVGAGGFRVEWLRERPFPESVRDAHSLYLETLAELGIVGFALLAAFLAGVALAGRRAHRLDPALATGPIAGVVTWAVHAGVDWDWELPALTLVAITLAALLDAREAAQ